MYTIKQLLKVSGLSRSTLLYYDKINLLKPSARSSSNYRLYTESDFHRLQQILLYRDMGLSLEKIAQLLDSPNNQTSQILEERLQHLNQEIYHLRHQQQLIIQLLGKTSLLKSSKTMNKEQWGNILKASGMSEADMRQWHIEFEQALPEMHSDFLESLGISPEEIRVIKSWSINN